MMRFESFLLSRFHAVDEQCNKKFCHFVTETENGRILKTIGFGDKIPNLFNENRPKWLPINQSNKLFLVLTRLSTSRNHSFFASIKNYLFHLYQ